MTQRTDRFGTLSGRRRALALLALGIFLAAPLGTPASTLPKPPAGSVSAITPIELRMHLEFLASTELGGRFTLSPTIKVAARYLASRLESYGYRGAGPNGSFLQPFDVVTSKTDPERSKLKLKVGGDEKEYAYGQFASFEPFEGEASGQIVFVGYGISSPSQKHDDYAGLDVRGKIVMYAPGTPSGVDSSKVGPTEKEYGAAKTHGAVGAIAFPSLRRAESAKGPRFREMAMSRTNETLAATATGGVPTVLLPPAPADQVLAPVGLSYDKLYDVVRKGGKLSPKALDATASITIALNQTKIGSQNVVGVLEGTDPKLKEEYLAISAHYDHLETKSDGTIYPGADDDGSGTSAVLTLARAFSLERPKRSIVVLFYAGEELGLLGSEYNADVAPAVPLDRIVADLNIDMIGRSKAEGDKNPANAELTDARSIYLIGADKISKEVHRISEATNDEMDRLRLDYTYNDPNHPSNLYYRSDHWNMAKHGIPVIFYFDGEHEDYHQTTDTVDKIDFDKMARVARLVFGTGWRIANLDHRPVKD